MSKSILFVSIFLLDVFAQSNPLGLFRPNFNLPEANEKIEGVEITSFRQFEVFFNEYVVKWEQEQLDNYKCPIENVNVGDYPWIYRTLSHTDEKGRGVPRKDLIELILNIHNLKVIEEEEPQIVTKRVPMIIDGSYKQIPVEGLVVSNWKEKVPKKKLIKLKVSSDIFKGANDLPIYDGVRGPWGSACLTLYHVVKNGYLKLVPVKNEEGKVDPQCICFGAGSS
ncbi:MAG: hypothetical protein R2827_12485 [Bdellovibrionales bacterium]